MIVTLSLIRAAKWLKSCTVGWLTESGFSVAAETFLALVFVVTITRFTSIIIVISVNKEITMRYVKFLTTTLNAAANQTVTVWCIIHISNDNFGTGYWGAIRGLNTNHTVKVVIIIIICLHLECLKCTIWRTLSVQTLLASNHTCTIRVFRETFTPANAHRSTDKFLLTANSGSTKITKVTTISGSTYSIKG